LLLTHNLLLLEHQLILIVMYFRLFNYQLTIQFICLILIILNILKLRLFLKLIFLIN